MPSAAATDDILHLLDMLSSEDDSVQDSAWNELSSLGVAAVPGLLDAIEGALRAEDAAKALRSMKLSGYTGTLFLLIALAWSVATGATVFGALGALATAIGAPFVGLGFLGVCIIRARRLERTARRGAYAREVLKSITDIRAINPLAERLSRGHRIVSAEAAWALERLLAEVTADDWNHVLSPSVCRKLTRVLVFSNADEHPRLLMEILAVLARADDTQGFYDIMPMARAKPTTPTEQLVVNAAAEYVTHITHSMGRQHEKSTLLRATESAPLDLLRPANAADAANSQLLRPATGETPPIA